MSKNHIISHLEIRFREKLIEYYRKLGGQQLGWSEGKQRQVVSQKIEGELGRHEVEALSRYTHLNGKKLLDVGSGFGEIIAFTGMQGGVAFGIEPDQARIEICKMRLALSGIAGNVCIGVGENLPFQDSTFDIVTCYTVLEHVQNPTAVIREMVRVLKAGGMLRIKAPTYLWPFESHYCIFYPPLLPKRVGRLYLRLRGRNPLFIDGINYTTLHSTLKALKKLGIKNCRNLAEDKICEPELMESKMYRFAARVIKTLHITHQLVPLYPIDLLIQK